MRTAVPEKLSAIQDEIDQSGYAALNRLTVIEEWFREPARLQAFGIFVASRASSRKGKSRGTVAELFKESRALLAGLDMVHPEVDVQAAEELHDRLRSFQDAHQKRKWQVIRVVRQWNLMLVEQGLAVYLWHSHSPPHGYKLAVDYCLHRAPRYGYCLTGPSRTKIGEIVRFIYAVEAQEEASEYRQGLGR